MQNVYRFVLAIACFLPSLSSACQYFGPRTAEDLPPGSWHQNSLSVFIGKIIEIKEGASDDEITIHVAERIKGESGDLLTTKHSRMLWIWCSLHRPVVGDNVLFALDPRNNHNLVPIDPTSAYAQALRDWKP